MSWVIDGNNLLGRAGAPRDTADAKRQLVRALSAFARAQRTKVACYFDGPEPEQFGKNLGSVSIVFSGSRSADELIIKRVSAGTGWKVVTADRALAARIKRREVSVVDPASFVTTLESLPQNEERASEEEWAAWFSDPKNRNVF